MFAAYSTPRSAAFAELSDRLQATTWSPNAFARAATSRPMAPIPAMPSVFPCTPSAFPYSLRSQRPARSEATASGIRRSSATIIAMTSSATAPAFRPGQFAT